MYLEKIDSCRICSNKNIEEFIDLGDQPPANSLIKNADDNEKFYPLSLSWCPECNLVQLNYTVDPKELFSNYFWVTSTSKVAIKHSKNFYEEIVKRKNNLRNGYVLEIASNDGTFLLPFVENNYKVLGVDPAKNIVDIANSKGVPTICEFFGVKTAKKIIDKHGKADVIFLRNVLPHVANLHDVVKGIELCLKDDGLCTIEFHYAKDIVNELHYDSIYHEHLCYFTLKSIEKLLHRYNLYVNDIKKSPISGGSLIIYLNKNIDKPSAKVKEYRSQEKKLKINELETWEDFAEKVKTHRKNLLDILNEVKNTGAKIVGYGASARSSTMLNYCGIDSDYIPMIADQNELKHNHFTAGTHIKIDSPSTVMKKNPDYVLLLAWNFSDEIMKILKEKYNFNGKCILPLPNDPKIIKCEK